MPTKSFKSLVKGFCLSICLLSLNSCDTGTEVGTPVQDGPEANTSATAHSANDQPYAIQYLYGFSYLATDFFALLAEDDMDDNPAKFIMSFFCSNLHATGIRFELQAYATKKHEDHGSDRPNPIIFTLLETVKIPTLANTKYVFGNSEVNLKKLLRLVRRGNQTLSGFHHFVFEPKVSPQKRLIYFKIFPANNAGQRIGFPDPLDKDKMLLEELYSNPSPPKRPARHNATEEQPE